MKANYVKAKYLSIGEFHFLIFYPSILEFKNQQFFPKNVSNNYVHFNFSRRCLKPGGPINRISEHVKFLRGLIFEKKFGQFNLTKKGKLCIFCEHVIQCDI